MYRYAAIAAWDAADLAATAGTGTAPADLQGAVASTAAALQFAPAEFPAAQAFIALIASGFLPEADVEAARAAANVDIRRLTALNLGVAGELSAPVDPSEEGPLGPLWPNGAPAWFPHRYPGRE